MSTDRVSDGTRGRGRRGPVPGTPRPPRMTRKQRQSQLLEIAERVFTQQGYQVTTMEDIAEQAGITKPVIYDHFGSKEGLLAASISRARTQLRDATANVWDTIPRDATPEVRLRVGIHAFFEFIDAHGPAFALIQQEGALGVAASPGIEDIRVDQSGIVARVLAHQPALASVPAAILQGYAEIIIGACERVAIWRLGQPDTSTTEATDLVMAVVWDGLKSLAPLPPLAPH